MNNTYGSGGELPYRDMEAAVRALTAKKDRQPGTTSQQPQTPPPPPPPIHTPDQQTKQAVV
ncbi:hypothetical protein B9Q04_15815 [Candidatus Marsarchaeota G2 archaeon BE_D]|uniref:Uncharacterized protein n=1 Tax=Candidatus Marsarchaeota G2 archaeon BE_D TaxID=1978158 RepID=A0A2R6C6E6_9ARCH|nr:MAG: hypothetical protein B9Q04_15815 [Candidatus Marsarchaeota G2 archaeon BE_D]